MNTLQKFEKAQVDKLRARKAPDFAPGDTVKVNVKVVEGDRERVQAFEGVCIARKNAGINSAFTVRKISLRRGRGARVPALFAAPGLDRGDPPRRRAPREALLPARPSRQVGAHHREDWHRRGRRGENRHSAVTSGIQRAA